MPLTAIVPKVTLAIYWKKKVKWTLRIGGVGALVGLWTGWRMASRVIYSDREYDHFFQGQLDRDWIHFALLAGMIALIWVVYFAVGTFARLMA